MPRGLAGRWFSLLRELGDCPDMAFGRIVADGRAVEWMLIPHEAADGIDALATLLRERGYTVEHTPRGRPPRGPKWWIVLRALCVTRLPTRGPRVPWADFEATVPPDAPCRAWTSFTRDDTTALEKVALNSNVSLNSLLLHTLNRAVDPLLSDPARPRIWMVPVNMRGVVGPDRRHRDKSDERGGGDSSASDTGDDASSTNHVSFIDCRTGPDATPRQVHAAIREELRRGVHLAAWWRMRAASWLGPKIMRKELRRNRDAPRYWTGLFSNVGAWSPAGGPEGVAWCAASPTLLAMAIGAVVLIWRGQLTMTFSVHPGIGNAQAKAQRVIDDWRAELLRMISKPPEPSKPSEPRPAAAAPTPAVA